MFTGIITSVGIIKSIFDEGDLRVCVNCDWDCSKIILGSSVACAGVCLTVVESNKDSFFVNVSKETIAKTTVGKWEKGTKLNLEPALRVDDELGGHMVSGHVDGLAEIMAITPVGKSHEVWLGCPNSIAVFLAEKGSVTLDGVSLTLNVVKENSFSVNIIEHTWDVTCWHLMKPGMKMNIEVDLIARYVARITNFNKE